MQKVNKDTVVRALDGLTERQLWLLYRIIRSMRG